MNRVTVESLISRVSLVDLECGHTFTYRRKLYTKVVHDDRDSNYAVCLSSYPMELIEFDRNATVTRCRVDITSSPICRLVNKIYKKRKLDA